MSWYAVMIASEKEKELERNLSYLDYHASFMNAEGVKRAKEFRESNKEGSIKEAEEFIETARTNDFKNNPLIDAIKKVREANQIKEDPGSALKSINLNKLIREDI
jgi:hypothetical protein